MSPNGGRKEGSTFASFSPSDRHHATTSSYVKQKTAECKTLHEAVAQRKAEKEKLKAGLRKAKIAYEAVKSAAKHGGAAAGQITALQDRLKVGWRWRCARRVNLIEGRGGWWIVLQSVLVSRAWRLTLFLPPRMSPRLNARRGNGRNDWSPTSAVMATYLMTIISRTCPRFARVLPPEAAVVVAAAAAAAAGVVANQAVVRARVAPRCSALVHRRAGWKRICRLPWTPNLFAPNTALKTRPHLPPLSGDSFLEAIVSMGERRGESQRGRRSRSRSRPGRYRRARV